MHFDDAISNVGAFGRYQILIIIIFVPITFLPGSITVSTIFTSAASQFNCSDNGEFDMADKNHSINRVSTNQCTIHNGTNSQTLSKCTSWSYSKVQYTSTAISQYNLVCHNAYLVPLIRTLYMFGFLVGGLSYGLLSDKFGRIWSFILASLNTGVSGVLVPFAPTWLWYAIGRFVVALGVSGMMTTTPPMLLEITTTQHRLRVFMITKYGWSLGCAYCGAVAYLVRSHANLEIILAAPAIALIAMKLLYPESPRWLFAKGDIDQSINVLHFIGRFNGKPLSEELVAQVKSLENVDKKQAEVTAPSLLDMLKDNLLRRVLIITWIIFTVNSFVYYGLIFSSSEFSQHLYLYVIIGSLVESQNVTFGIFIGTRFGRVVWLALSMSLTGIFCFFSIFIPPGWLLSLLTILGRFFIVSSFSAIWFYSAEVFPTVVRAACVGSGSMWGRVGAMVAPLLMYTKSVSAAIPFIIYVVLCVLGVLSLLFLPETKGIESPDSLDEARILYKNHFFKNRRRHPKLEGNKDDSSMNMVA